MHKLRANLKLFDINWDKLSIKYQLNTILYQLYHDNCIHHYKL